MYRNYIRISVVTGGTDQFSMHVLYMAYFIASTKSLQSHSEAVHFDEDEYFGWK